MQLHIDAGLWKSLGEEALSQEVSAPQLLEHAVLHLAAEDNADRVTERFLEDLDNN